jgi:hypothetical protein
MAWRDPEFRPGDANRTLVMKKIPLISMVHKSRKSAFPNFSSSDSWDFKGLSARKLGFLFFQRERPHPAASLAAFVAPRDNRR